MEYTELFDARGRSYDEAMKAFPEARRQEFAQAVARCGLRAGMHVADVPAGGGYLTWFLPAGCVWHGHEPSTGFSGDRAGHHDTLTATARDLLPLPWETGTVDAAISLAGVHHLEDKTALFAELRRTVRLGGRFVLSDVEAGSPPARFLDGHVDACSSTGHRGQYLDRQTEIELEAAGWRCIASEYVALHWTFADRRAMGHFCRDLFGLVQGGLEETLAAIESGLGVDRLDDGGVGMRWGLRTIVAQ